MTAGSTPLELQSRIGNSLRWKVERGRSARSMPRSVAAGCDKFAGLRVRARFLEIAIRAPCTRRPRRRPICAGQSNDPQLRCVRVRMKALRAWRTWSVPVARGLLLAPRTRSRFREKRVCVSAVD